MDRETLGKMKLEALRLLAAERGIEGARELGKPELLDRLAPKTIVERAKEAVAHAVEVVEEKAHELADRVKHRPPTGHAHEPAAPAPPPGGFGVPSATVHHAPLVAPGEPIGMLDFEELPETYGVDECEVLYKDPFWVFAYWEVTDGGIDAARAQLGPSAANARLVLRLFTTAPAGVQPEREVHDIDLPSRHGRRYLPSVRPGAHLRVAVGLLSVEGYFASIAHSSLQRIPHAEPAPPGPVEWMEVIPPRSRGREKEPLVIVRRGAGHTERGAEPAAGGEPGGSSSTTRPRGSR
jgi:hypothetical protein